jgi:hypothetical protein
MTNDRSRRQFFTTAAAGRRLDVVREAAGARYGRAGGDPVEGVKLGVASYSMREFTLDQALEMAKTLGVTRMTFKDVHVPRTDPPEATRALRAKIEAAGITIMGGGTITIPNDAAKIEKEFVLREERRVPADLRRPRAGGARHDRAAGEELRHQGRHPQPRSGGQALAAAAGRLRRDQDARQTPRPLHRRRSHAAHRDRSGAGVPRVPRSPLRHARERIWRRRPRRKARSKSAAV